LPAFPARPAILSPTSPPSHWPPSNLPLIFPGRDFLPSCSSSFARVSFKFPTDAPPAQAASSAFHRLFSTGLARLLSRSGVNRRVRSHRRMGEPFYGGHWLRSVRGLVHTPGARRWLSVHLILHCDSFGFFGILGFLNPDAPRSIPLASPFMAFFGLTFAGRQAVPKRTTLLPFQRGIQSPTLPTDPVSAGSESVSFKTVTLDPLDVTVVVDLDS